jgi:hypothetical protein
MYFVEKEVLYKIQNRKYSLFLSRKRKAGIKALNTR